MRAAVMRNSRLEVDTVPDPRPREGEILARTLACGICGSDLHFLRHGARLVEAARESGTPLSLDLACDIILGHEFCAEVLEFGPNTSAAVQPGQRVVSMPALFRDGAMHGIGYSNEAPGGYGELMLLSAGLALPVPDDLSSEHAALTEPMAVGIHAVAKARMEAGDAAVVLGCGPVGLAVIAALALRGLDPILAADYSPMRRRLAEGLGARTVVDPTRRSVFDAYKEIATGRPVVVFECVGVPGMLSAVMRDAPQAARVVVAGVCMEDDVIRPVFAVTKELSFQFVFGYEPQEFAEGLSCIADGRFQVAPLITGRVDIAGIPAAFEALSRPDEQAKILIKPDAASASR